MSFSNQIKTVVLLGLLTGILLWVGQLLGGPEGLTVALIFAFFMNFFAYWFSDKMVLAMYRGKEITESENPRLYRLVREVAQLARLPMPKVYVLPGQYSNAFATGRSPKKAAVAFSQGILALLNDSELKGVIAHELAHIKNRDMLISTVAAMIAGVISYVAMMARWAAIFGGSRNRDSGNIVEFLVLAILTPFLATLIRLAISRSREFLADEKGAKFVHSGLGLASALEKLEGDIKRKPMRVTGTTETTAHLFIANPFSKKNGFVKMFLTHPPSEERIKRLRRMSF